ncbi:uncharacterized protein, PH0010 family/AmmeMemoRadiSam system protein A/AmmeMemoRadiSam system protein B [Natronincola peptidivorans]|uniref:Uncharacterized protein, PH0010 family/AmmeMemoRadiSam system protein A/AmmeMemoRadiSam system protein B n=1 Tax=Natronincola peptidivorans TaxID=426128 RepID=A0A1I0DNH6_9FIRM|nr:AmmeMemoRadiSam system protein A [Natronincola peptidivorans]SET33257.1 uncharacterized protein, PH0010 family/AmmeMemoRadiSam system protein A/AmmeMemoRadiSam system protein B [Natronincola peptidivorans]
MKKLQGVAISPHPPIIILEVGGGREREAQKTIDGMTKMVKTIAEKQPELIVLITPHGTVFQDGVSVLAEETLKGDLSKFGVSSLKLEKSMNIDFIKALATEFEKNQAPSVFLNKSLAIKYDVKVELDHGAFVPLYYLDRYWKDYKIAHITIGILSQVELYEIGKIIRDTVEKTNDNTIIIASGDLSHCLVEDGPYPYHPMGEVFDKKIVQAVEAGDIGAIINMSDSIADPAGECGLKPITMALGALDGYEIEPKVFSYEGPFGVGYLTAFIEASENTRESILEKEKKKIEEQYHQKRKMESPYVALARNTIEDWIEKGKKFNFNQYKKEIEDSTWKHDVEEKRAGAFVSIHKNGELRGCIGTIEATEKNIAEEIIRNAIQAAVDDPRFSPIREEELKALEIKVDILHDKETVDTLAELDVEKYGVIVEAGYKRGLLLPNLEGVNTVEEQINIAKKKAGIQDGEKIKIYRFEVTRYQ